MRSDAPDPSALGTHVAALQGERHPDRSPEGLEAALCHVEQVLSALGLYVERDAFDHRGRTFENVVGRLAGADPGAPRVLVGAHVDTRPGTPGADDNASGVAGLLETARLLTAGPALQAPLELVAFNLEEWQGGLDYALGSRHHARSARRTGVRYAGALVLEMIGYRSTEAGSQRVPLPIRWMDLPRTGDFIAAVGDRRSRRLLRTFREAAADAAPDLKVVTLTVPLRGWLVPDTRRSDNAPFWSAGYPALLITDTANLRTPHYHRPSDRLETLDLDFAASVTAAVVATARALGSAAPPVPPAR